MSASWGQRRLVQAIWDGVAWIVAVPLAVSLRYDFLIPPSMLSRAFAAGVCAALVYVAVSWTFRMYQGRYVVGSFDEVFGVVWINVAVGGIGSAILFVIPPGTLPRSTFFIALGIAAALMLGARFLWRGTRRHSALGRGGRRTLIYGAGDAGSQVVQLLLADRSGEFQPVGFIDDDPSKHHLRRSGVRVLGTLDALETMVTKFDVQTLLVAIAGISAERLLDLDRRCTSMGVTVRLIPTASEIVGGAVRLGDISDVTEEDLMGRRPIHTDESRITSFIRDQRVLITGAGGSIGSELARQVTRYRPSFIGLLDRDESALHSLMMSLDGTGDLTSDALVLADIRDGTRMDEVFSHIKPDIVFHAAALKHLPLLEKFPNEAIKTNVLGTKNVLQASRASGVSVFVNISTDKAADPISALGFSKLITERLTANEGLSGRGRYMSVRFGNVLGSRGSVLDTFRFQIANGGPVTVTDEHVTRYFMTISEAVHLVLQASVIGESGETLVLDMGAPVRIVDVARYMIGRSGREIDIQFTGLRPGEKVDESLIAAGEKSSIGEHPLISHIKVRPLSLEDTSRAPDDSEASEFLAHHARL